LITATGQFTTLWRFDGTAGQIVDIAVDAISADFDPSVSLLRFDGVALLSDDNSGDGLNARIQQFLLPDSALYFIKISGGGVQRAYTLTLNTGIASLLAYNQPVTSTTQITSLWRFTGAAGQVVDIQLAGASESFDPSLALLAPDGRELAYNDDGGKGNSSYDAYLQNVVLPQSGEYFIRAGRAGSQSVYTLTLTAITPLTTAIGSPIALGDGPLWQFPGATGQIVHIAHIGSGESAPRFTLVSPMGESLVADAKETVVKLVSDGNYLLAVRGASEAMGDATIHLEEIGNDQVQPLTVSQTITGELAGLSSSYRRFTGVLSHTIVITLSGETEQLHLALYDPKGNPIAAFDGSINTGEPRLRAALAFTGTYLLTAQGVDAQSQGDYSLTLGLVETNALPIPQACGMTDATADYGPFVIGSQVVLGRHRAVNGDMDWTDEMNQYVDQMAIVEEFDGVDGPGCPGVHVDIDNGRWFWRIRDMVLVDP
jgi:hypothetical protein